MRKPERYLHNLSLATLLAATFTAALVPQVSGMHAVPDTHDWSADAVAMVDEQVATMTAGRDCTGADQPRLVDHVLVRGARVADGDGTAVARWVTFDQALALTGSGRAIVLRYCA